MVETKALAPAARTSPSALVCCWRWHVAVFIYFFHGAGGCGWGGSEGDSLTGGSDSLASCATTMSPINRRDPLLTDALTRYLAAMDLSAQNQPDRTHKNQTSNRNHTVGSIFSSSHYC